MSDIPAIVIDNGTTEVVIPECCREGWGDCPHVAKKPREKKNNRGL